MARWQVLFLLIAVRAGCAGAFFGDIVDAVKDVVDGVVDAAEEVGDAVTDTTRRRRSVRRRRARLPVIDDVADALDDAVDAVGDVVEDVVDTVGDVAQDAADAIGDAAEDVGDGIEDAVDAVGDVVEDVVDGIGDVVESVGDGVVLAFTNPEAFIGDVVDTVLSLPGEVVQGVVGFSDEIIDHLERVPFVGEVLEQGQKLLAPLIDAAASAIQKFGEAVADLVGVLAVGLADAVAWFVGGLAELFACIFDTGETAVQKSTCLALLSGCDCEEGRSFVSLSSMAAKARCAAPIELSGGLQLGAQIGSAPLKADLTAAPAGCTEGLATAVRGRLDFQPTLELEVSPAGNFKFSVFGTVHTSIEALVNASGTCSYGATEAFPRRPLKKLLKIKHAFFYIFMYGELDVRVRGTLRSAVKALADASFTFKATGEVTAAGSVTASAHSEGLTYRRSAMIGGSIDATLEFTLTPHVVLLPIPGVPVLLRAGVTMEVKAKGAGEWTVGSSGGAGRRLARPSAGGVVSTPGARLLAWPAVPSDRSLPAQRRAASRPTGTRETRRSGAGAALTPPSNHADGAPASRPCSRRSPLSATTAGGRGARQLSGGDCFTAGVSVLATVQVSGVGLPLALLDGLGDAMGEALALGAQAAADGLVAVGDAFVGAATQCFIPSLSGVGQDITDAVRAGSTSLLNTARAVIDNFIPSLNLDFQGFPIHPWYGVTLLCKTLASTSTSTCSPEDFLTCPADPVARVGLEEALPQPTWARRAMVYEAGDVTAGSWVATSTSEASASGTSTATSGTGSSTATSSSSGTSTSSYTWTSSESSSATSTETSTQSSTLTDTMTAAGESENSSALLGSSTGAAALDVPLQGTGTLTLTHTAGVTGTSTRSPTFTRTSSAIGMLSLTSTITTSVAITSTMPVALTATSSATLAGTSKSTSMGRSTSRQSSTLTGTSTTSSTGTRQSSTPRASTSTSTATSGTGTSTATSSSATSGTGSSTATSSSGTSTSSYTWTSSESSSATSTETSTQSSTLTDSMTAGTSTPSLISTPTSFAVGSDILSSTTTITPSISEISTHPLTLTSTSYVTGTSTHPLTFTTTFVSVDTITRLSTSGSPSASTATVTNTSRRSSTVTGTSTAASTSILSSTLPATSIVTGTSTHSLISTPTSFAIGSDILSSTTTITPSIIEISTHPSTLTSTSYVTGTSARPLTFTTTFVSVRTITRTQSSASTSLSVAAGTSTWSSIAASTATGASTRRSTLRATTSTSTATSGTGSSTATSSSGTSTSSYTWTSSESSSVTSTETSSQSSTHTDTTAPTGLIGSNTTPSFLSVTATSAVGATSTPSPAAGTIQVAWTMTSSSTATAASVGPPASTTALGGLSGTAGGGSTTIGDGTLTTTPGPGSSAAEIRVSGSIEVYSQADVSNAIQEFLGTVLGAMNSSEPTFSISSKVSARLTFAAARRLSGPGPPAASSAAAVAAVGKMRGRASSGRRMTACTPGTEVEVQAETFEQFTTERQAAIDSRGQAPCSETAPRLDISITVTTENAGALTSDGFASQLTQDLLEQGFDAPLVLAAAVTETATSTATSRRLTTSLGTLTMTTTLTTTTSQPVSEAFGSGAGDGVSVASITAAVLAPILLILCCGGGLWFICRRRRSEAKAEVSEPPRARPTPAPPRREQDQEDDDDEDEEEEGNHQKEPFWEREEPPVTLVWRGSLEMPPRAPQAAPAVAGPSVHEAEDDAEFPPRLDDEPPRTWWLRFPDCCHNVAHPRVDVI